MMSDKLREAAQGALEWLETSKKQSIKEYMQVVDALRAALAEPEQEYVCKCGLRVVPHQCKTNKEF
jgi:hypothetical protein